MADVVESLFVEFESTLEMTTVVRVVRGGQREMAISGSSSPDLLHSRARRRLQTLVTIKQRRPNPTDKSTTNDCSRPGRTDEDFNVKPAAINRARPVESKEDPERYGH